jgi:hypothetical protein
MSVLFEREIYFDVVRASLFSGALTQQQVLFFGLGSLIKPLFMVGRPAAVTRLIVTVVVDAIQRHVIRTFAHVSEKVAEAVWSLPPFTYLDAAPAIGLPEFVLGVRASCSHPTPSLPHCRPLADLSVPVTKVSLTSPLVHQAAARLYSSVTNMAALDDFLGAAIASAKPQNMLAGVVASLSNNRQAAKALVCQIDEGWHV